MRKKFKFYKKLVVEIVETLIAICKYLEFESRYQGRRGLHLEEYFRSHEYELSKLSNELKGIDEEKK